MRIVGPPAHHLQWPAQRSFQTHYTQAGESKLGLLRVISFIFRASATWQS
jgi:hypothetical protein